MTISVIIPTLNEENCLEQTLASIRRQSPFEIIVADGGSIDRTVRIARSADILVCAAKGRAKQMNAGAARAGGEVLMFLHADCRLEEGALASARAALSRRDVIAGCFRMEIDVQGWAYRCIASCAAARVRLARVIYGDQGLFIRRESFARTGGYPDIDFMEDVYFTKRLAQEGRLVVVPRTIFVSARRWQRQGVLTQTVRNWALTAAALLGVHPNWLGRFYTAVR
jgi:rSAM/selenodomain-associated transferase 2